MVINMKNLIKLYHELASITRYLLHFLIIFSATSFLISLFCFIIADKTHLYYDMRILSLDLITVLRASFFIISSGIILTEKIEKYKNRL